MQGGVGWCDSMHGDGARGVGCFYGVMGWLVGGLWTINEYPDCMKLIGRNTIRTGKTPWVQIDSQPLDAHRKCCTGDIRSEQGADTWPAAVCTFWHSWLSAALTGLWKGKVGTSHVNLGQ